MPFVDVSIKGKFSKGTKNHKAMPLEQNKERDTYFKSKINFGELCFVYCIQTVCHGDSSSRVMRIPVYIKIGVLHLPYIIT